jgi:hypothetical protein
MSETITIQLSIEAKTKLAEIARDCNLPLANACEIILTQFAQMAGGSIYTGRWREHEGGLMFAVQWPFLTGLAKHTAEELTKMGVK